VSGARFKMDDANFDTVQLAFSRNDYDGI